MSGLIKVSSSQAGCRNNLIRRFGEYILLPCEIRIRSPIRLALEDERVHSCHSPCVLRCSWAMSRPPRRHTTIVDSSQCLGRNLCTARNRRQCRGTWTLFVKPRCVRRTASFDALIRLPRRIRPWVLPRHAGSTSCVAFAFAVLACRQSPIVFRRPVHCFPVR